MCGWTRNQGLVHRAYSWLRPGDRPDAAFAEVAARLRAAGVRVLGYADTDYGRRPRADVVRDLSRYHEWYGTDGAFLDQVAAGPDEFTHCQPMAVAAWALGCATLVLNHGTPPHPAYARIADVLVTFEGTWTSYRRQRPEPWPGGTGVRLCHLVYGVPPGVDLAETARAWGATVHCAVPGVGDRPWGTLPHTLESAR
ncbi:spherulation-specific family 4 protein [Streptomyces deserti]